MSKAIGITAAIVIGALFLVAVPFLWLATEAPARPVCGFIDGGIIVTAPGDPNLPADGRLSAEQSFYASVIVSEVVRRGLPVKAAEIAIATAITESSLTNPGQEQSDLDSSGLFQQRAMFYTTINPMDPVQATNAFLDELVVVPDWQTRPLAEVAQAVQSSAFPDAYGTHDAATVGIVTALWSKAGTLPACARGEVLAGNYTLPLTKQIFDAHPEYLTRPHHDYPAVDIAVTAGTPVYAVAGGRVVASPVGGDCGNGVGIQGDDGVEYIYCHGEVAIAPLGARVTVGELIMRSGWSGHVDPPGPAGAHLHLQIKVPGVGFVCPQRALEAWNQRQAVDLFQQPTSGCTY